MNRSLFLAPLALTALTSTALAHFLLVEPKQDRLDTQGKTGPCGNGVSAADAVVTNLTPGQTLTLKVDVTTPHPGYYRVVLSKDGTFPKVPAGACSTLKPNLTPSQPILKEEARKDDAMGVHPIEVTVPNEPCPNCVMQVIQVMTDPVPSADNPNPNCFYYHCAKVNVGTAVTPPPDPGPTTPAPDAGPDDSNPNNSGGGSTGGCSTTGGQLGWMLLAFGALLSSLRRRSNN